MTFGTSTRRTFGTSQVRRDDRLIVVACPATSFPPRFARDPPRIDRLLQVDADGALRQGGFLGQTAFRRVGAVAIHAHVNAQREQNMAGGWG